MEALKLFGELGAAGATVILGFLLYKALEFIRSMAKDQTELATAQAAAITGLATIVQSNKEEREELRQELKNISTNSTKSTLLLESMAKDLEKRTMTTAEYLAIKRAEK